MNRKIVIRIGMTIFILIVVVLGTIWYANNLIRNAAIGKTFSDVNDIPKMKVGLLLGTSKLNRSGGVNAYFENRIAATIELFKARKIEDVIISGDNSKSFYDEPTDMMNELIKNGIDSTKIFRDYAGFRTFDSMVRLKEIFSQDKVIIISQKFHNERAIYISEKLGIKAIGYNAKDVDKYFGLKTMIREKFARVKVILDFVFGVKPKFLGKKVEIQ